MLAKGIKQKGIPTESIALCGHIAQAVENLALILGFILFALIVLDMFDFLRMRLYILIEVRMSDHFCQHIRLSYELARLTAHNLRKLDFHLLLPPL